MIMTLVGKSAEKQGVSRDEGKQPYHYYYLHLVGKTVDVQGETVAKVKVDLLKMQNLPPFELGERYDVTLSDRGMLRDIAAL